MGLYLPVNTSGIYQERRDEFLGRRQKNIPAQSFLLEDGTFQLPPEEFDVILVVRLVAVVLVFAVLLCCNRIASARDASLSTLLLGT